MPDFCLKNKEIVSIGSYICINKTLFLDTQGARCFTGRRQKVLGEPQPLFRGGVERAQTHHATRGLQ